MTRIGRPDDKSKYINLVLNALESHAGDEALTTALSKLNARELVVLNTHIAKQNRMSLEDAISLLPSKTPAQKIRVDSAIKLYQELESKNASYTTGETNEKTNEETVGANAPIS